MPFTGNVGGANPSTKYPGALDNFGAAAVWDPAIGLAVDALEQQTAGPSVFNVKAYGALGDGATDDTAAIQSAINACQTAGGGTVYFPRGNYHVTPVSATTAALTITKSGVSLVGSNYQAAFLRKTANGLLLDMSGTATGTANHLEYLTVRDLGFHGANFTGMMFRCYYCDDYTFERVYVTQNSDVVLGAAEFWDSRIQNCYFDTNGGPLGSTGTTPNIWLRNSAASSGFGLSTDSVNQIYITDTHFESFTDGAIRVEAGPGNANTPQGFYFTNNKMEASHILNTSSYLYADSSVQQLFVNNLYVYVGGFGAGFSTSITAITWHCYDSSLENVTIANNGTDTVNIGVDWFSNSQSVLRNVIGRYTTAPDTAHINFNNTSTGNFVMQNCFAPTGGTQFAGIVPNFVGGVNSGAYVSGQWYPSTALSITSAAQTTGKLYGYPFLVTATHEFQAIGCWIVTGGTTAVVRFGIYSDNGGTPVGGNLILDAGTTAANSSGAAASIAITQWLEPGLYWLSYVQNSAGAGASAQVDNSTRGNLLTGQTALAAAQACTAGFASTGTSTTGALPAVFPAAAAATNIPLVLVEAL